MNGLTLASGANLKTILCGGNLLEGSDINAGHANREDETVMCVHFVPGMRLC